ncbi:PREDICTED: speckle-type POZ protein-like [Polistes dominula]|uniref:Speckle-type POZ protein-like n=1 Tax=Polistes dominula TaxID=743375 RepID=A0ABM1J5G4_POLDO|nr:PREDICTED: speckle-type POZ protein-like [Polistes dominula]
MDVEPAVPEKTSVSHVWNVTSTEYFFNLSEKLTSKLFIERYKGSTINYKICIDCDRQFQECSKCFKNSCKNVEVYLIFFLPLPENLVIDIEYKIREDVEILTIAETSININRECEKREFSICKNCEKELNLACKLIYNVKLDKSDYAITSDESSPPLSWESSLINYLNEVFRTGKFSDMSIYVQSKEFKVHSPILSQYPYLKSLIIKAKKEDKKRIDLDGITSDAFEKILTYIYTGDESCINNLAYELIMPAHQLHIDDLVENCAKILQMEININNSIDMYILAHRVEAYELFLDAKRFIASNYNVIKELPSYQNFHQRYVELEGEILEYRLHNTS